MLRRQAFGRTSEPRPVCGSMFHGSAYPEQPTLITNVCLLEMLHPWSAHLHSLGPMASASAQLPTILRAHEVGERGQIYPNLPS